MVMPPREYLSPWNCTPSTLVPPVPPTSIATTNGKLPIVSTLLDELEELLGGATLEIEELDAGMLLELIDDELLERTEELDGGATLLTEDCTSLDDEELGSGSAVQAESPAASAKVAPIRKGR